MTEKEKDSFCSYLRKEFGLSISNSNELLPILYLLYISSFTLKKTSDELRTQNAEMLKKLNSNQYNFNSKGTAKEWWWGKIWYLIILFFFIWLSIFGCYLFYNEILMTRKQNEEFIKSLSIEKDENGQSNFSILNSHEKKNDSTSYELIKNGNKVIGVKIFMINKK